MKNRFIMGLVAGALALVTMAVPQVIQPPAYADPCFTPMTTTDGVWRCDVTLIQNTYNNQLAVVNSTKHLVKISYNDPTYGAQSISVAAGQDNRNAIICANRSYDALVTVVFDADTATPSTATGHYTHGAASSNAPVQSAQAALTRDLKRLAVAQKKLKKAKRHHQHAKVKRLKKRVRQIKSDIRVDRQDLKVARADASYCDTRQVK